jgi:hypothetical protein
VVQERYGSSLWDEEHKYSSKNYYCKKTISMSKSGGCFRKHSSFKNEIYNNNSYIIHKK